MTPDTNGKQTGRVPPVEHRFKPGQVANPTGRPKGSRNKLGEAFVEALQADFEQHGMSVIEAVRNDKPDQYLKVIASVIPKEIHHSVEDVKQLDDDDLHARFIAAVARLNRSRDATAGNRAPTIQGALSH